MNIKRRRIIGFTLIFIIICVVWFWISSILYDVALSVQQKKLPILESRSANIPVELQAKNAKRPEGEIETIKQQQINIFKNRKADDIKAHAFFKNKQKDVYITSFDNLKLHGIVVLYEEPDCETESYGDKQQSKNDGQKVQLYAEEILEKHPEQAEGINEWREIDTSDNQEGAQEKHEELQNSKDEIEDITSEYIEATNSWDYIQNSLLSHKWVIMVHGYRDDADTIFAEGLKFYELGYNLLLVDLRGHGSSEGDFFTMGWYERIDIKGWINKIVDLDPYAQIVLYGISMGAATVMMTLGEKLPSNVKAGIEDCGYSSVYSIFLCCLNSMFGISGIPARLLLNCVLLYVKIKDGYWITDASSVKQLQKNKRPVLFIHGDSDTFVPTSMVDMVFAASNTNILKKEKIIVKDSPHAMNDYVDSQLYWSSVYNFLQKHIK